MKYRGSDAEGIKHLLQDAGQPNGQMKVFIMSSVHVWNDARVFYKQAVTLASRYDVELHAVSDQKAVTRNNVKVWGLPIYGRRCQRSVNWVRLLVRAVRSGADVYILHDPELLPIGILIGFLTGRPVIYDVHEDFPSSIEYKQWIPRVLRKPVSLIYQQFEKISVDLLHGIITADDGVASQFPRAKRSLVLYNFPPKELFEKTDSKSYLQREFDIVYAGTFSHFDLNAIFEIASKLKERQCHVNWCIIGRGEKGQQELIETELTLRSLRNNFHFTGQLDHAQVAQYLWNSKIGIVPARSLKKYSKNIPMKMFEYMSCALPFVATDLPPTRKFVGETGCAFLVEPANMEAYVDKLEHLLRKPKQAESMGQVGKKLVDERYNWESEKKKLLDFFEGLISQC